MRRQRPAIGAGLTYSRTMRAGFVALVGRPNAGKSTLLNRLVGEKVAITSDKPQTTRTRILGVKTTEDAQCVFVDTPGIHKPMHRMNARMVEAATSALDDVDVIVWVCDATEPLGGGVHYILELLSKVDVPVILALNKVDRIQKPKLLPLIAAFAAKREFHAIVPVSALAGDNADALEREIVAALPESDPLYPDDYLTDQAERTYASEIVREKLLHHLREELPYTTAVLVDSFQEPGDDGLMRISCVILVEAASQKGIVLGKGGEMIKRIGSEARLELERFFGTRIFLDLHVKVRGEWRNDERILDELGLGKHK